MLFLIIGVLVGFVGYTVYYIIKTFKEKKKNKIENNDNITPNKE